MGVQPVETSTNQANPEFIVGEPLIGLVHDGPKDVQTGGFLDGRNRASAIAGLSSFFLAVGGASVALASPGSTAAKTSEPIIFVHHDPQLLAQRASCKSGGGIKVVDKIQLTGIGERQGNPVKIDSYRVTNSGKQSAKLALGVMVAGRGGLSEIESFDLPGCRTEKVNIETDVVRGNNNNPATLAPGAETVTIVKVIPGAPVFPTVWRSKKAAVPVIQKVA